MSKVKQLFGWVGKRLDRIDERIDKPAQDHGTYLQGSEAMVDNEDTPKATGEAIRNKHSGFGRR